jgi:tetratricopeptide (TPR) repeat protein
LHRNQPLTKAQALVKRGQFDAAIKIYRAILHTNQASPRIYGLLGALLIQVGQNEQAAKVLEEALKAEPTNVEHLIRLLAAHHRAGNLVRCRELLVLGESLMSEQELAMFEHGISQPPASRLDALKLLLKKQNYVSAEISARMFIEDFPQHPFGWTMLREVFNATGRALEAQALLDNEPLAAAPQA